MNERIRELAEQAIQEVAPGVEYKIMLSPAVEKFAELIIQEFAYECIDVTNQGERIQWIAKKWGISI